jgi:hypothetical protein
VAIAVAFVAIAGINPKRKHSNASEIHQQGPAPVQRFVYPLGAARKDLATRPRPAGRAKMAARKAAGFPSPQLPPGSRGAENSFAEEFPGSLAEF